MREISNIAFRWPAIIDAASSFSDISLPKPETTRCLILSGLDTTTRTSSSLKPSFLQVLPFIMYYQSQPLYPNVHKFHELRSSLFREFPHSDHCSKNIICGRRHPPPRSSVFLPRRSSWREIRSRKPRFLAAFLLALETVPGTRERSLCEHTC